MNSEKKHCLNCNRSEDEIPFVNLTFSGKPAFICSRCLPVLMHEPEKLIGKLKSAENIPSASAD